MDLSDHIRQAIHHLEHAAAYDHSHLLLEKRTDDWTERVLSSAACVAALSLLRTETQVRTVQPEAWLSDLRHGTDPRPKQLVDE